MQVRRPSMSVDGYEDLPCNQRPYILIILLAHGEEAVIDFLSILLLTLF